MPTRLDGLCGKGLHDLTKPENRQKDGHCRQCRYPYQLAKNREYRARDKATAETVALTKEKTESSKAEEIHKEQIK